MGAGDLGCPDGQRCAESQLPGGGGAAAANCCLLLEMPVLRGLAWGLFIAGGAKQLPAWPHVEGAWTAAGLGRGMLEFYHRGGASVPLGLCSRCPGRRLVGDGESKTHGCALPLTRVPDLLVPPQQCVPWLLLLRVRAVPGVPQGLLPCLCAEAGLVLSLRQGSPVSPVPAW